MALWLNPDCDRGQSPPHGIVTNAKCCDVDPSVDLYMTFICLFVDDWDDYRPVAEPRL